LYLVRIILGANYCSLDADTNIRFATWYKLSGTNLLEKIEIRAYDFSTNDPSAAVMIIWLTCAQGQDAIHHQGDLKASDFDRIWTDLSNLGMFSKPDRFVPLDGELYLLTFCGPRSGIRCMMIERSTATHDPFWLRVESIFSSVAQNSKYKSVLTNMTESVALETAYIRELTGTRGTVE
jgi:hypothetical protein